MRCRKYNFVSIDVEVGLLLTFLASMKAKECLYQNYVSIFRINLSMKFFHLSNIRFQSIHSSYWIQKLLESLGIRIEFY